MSRQVAHRHLGEPEARRLVQRSRARAEQVQLDVAVGEGDGRICSVSVNPGNSTTRDVLRITNVWIVSPTTPNAKARASLGGELVAQRARRARACLELGCAPDAHVSLAVVQ